MSELDYKSDAAVAELEPEDPFRYGWRYVASTLPDGSRVYEQVPLIAEDLLYPEEDDFVVQKPPHQRDMHYLHASLERHFAAQPDVVVLADCLVDWGVAEVRPMGPDITVLFGVDHWLQQGTFRVAEEGGRPVLAIEITSPSTRDRDVKDKPQLLYQAGVEKYVIVDRGPEGEDPAQLRGYQRGPSGWLPLLPDSQGRLDLSPVGLLLDIVDDHPWLYDAVTGQRFVSNLELGRAVAEAEAKAQEESRARTQAEAKAQQEAQARAAAEAKAQQEAQARAAAEAKAQQEAQARADAEAKAQQEAQTRADAESRARDAETRAERESVARARLEDRLRELENQLRRQRPDG
jgi:Uma2 family endonuclease